MREQLIQKSVQAAALQGVRAVSAVFCSVPLPARARDRTVAAECTMQPPWEITAHVNWYNILVLKASVRD